MFSESVGVRDSNEAEVHAILEAIRIFTGSFLRVVNYGKQFFNCHFVGYPTAKIDLEDFSSCSIRLNFVLFSSGPLYSYP